ncbi:MAG: hypothetical protein PHR28_08355 [candidate division Zixibacteria bacterium]|nr:hypothetical protein [candidate division Zixibacteria bacterium]
MRLPRLATIILVVLMAGTASAQFLGQMSPASVLPTNSGKFGAYAILAEHSTGVVGSLRYGFSDYLEGRARLGFIDPESGDMGVIFGGDFKYLLWKYKENQNPIDLSLGGFLEYCDNDYSSILGLGGSVIGSIPFHLNNNRTIEPYARLNLRMQRQSFDHGADSNTDLKGGVNIGALFLVTPLVDFTAEIQIDDEWAFMVGVDFVAF